MDYSKLNGLKFDGGTIVLKIKGSKIAIQLQKEDGLHTLGMLVDGKVVKDFGQMEEVLDLLNPVKCDNCNEEIEDYFPLVRDNPAWCSECFQDALNKTAEKRASVDGHTHKIGRFTVIAKEWKKGNQHRVYFSLDTSAQACYDMNEGVFIKCRGRVGARFEHAIKEAFNL